MALIWKKGYFNLLFTFFSHHGNVTKIPTAHILLTYMYFAHPIDFFTLPILKKKIRIYQVYRYGFSLVWVLVLILISAILEQSINNKMVSKI